MLESAYHPNHSWSKFSFGVHLGTSSRIMLIEDDLDVQEAMGEFLQAEGYELALARNGREALAELERSPDVALIILDLLMPDLNGWEFRLLQWKDARYADIPVVMVSGAVSIRQTADLLQAAAFFAKPVDPSALLATIRRLIPVARSSE